MADQKNGKTLPTLKMCGIPGGGAGAYAPEGSYHPGDEVMLTSNSKGARPGKVSAVLGTIFSQVLNTKLDIYSVRADKVEQTKAA